MIVRKGRRSDLAIACVGRAGPDGRKPDAAALSARGPGRHLAHLTSGRASVRWGAMRVERVGVYKVSLCADTTQNEQRPDM